MASNTSNPTQPQDNNQQNPKELGSVNELSKESTELSPKEHGNI